MKIIFLSGGSGKRLWPLSNEVRSKQFLKIFKKADGSHESMVQRMARMLTDADPEADITFATSESQVNSIRSQLAEDVDISVEPCRRDTFPAIALACAYLHDVRKVKEEEAVVVCPIDPYVEEDYFEALKRLHDLAAGGGSKLVLMGIAPTYPSAKYGYILTDGTGDSPEVSRVSAFKEKPSEEAAAELIRQGALWNGGIFAFRLNYLLQKSQELLGTADYRKLFDSYEILPKISFDYAVAEKEKDISVLRFSGAWKDLGTWNTLTEAMADPVRGKAVAGECENTHIINELQIPLVALGCSNMAIAATPDGILVTDKAASTKLKDYVTDARPMFERRVWGEYKVLDYRITENGQNSLTKHLIVRPGQHISYQIHRHRAECWTITDGEGILILDGKVEKVQRGSTAYITPGTKHAIKADTELHIIEVQIGDELTEEDIERLPFDWDDKNFQR